MGKPNTQHMTLERAAGKLEVQAALIELPSSLPLRGLDTPYSTAIVLALTKYIVNLASCLCSFWVSAPIGMLLDYLRERYQTVPVVYY